MVFDDNIKRDVRMSVNGDNKGFLSIISAPPKRLSILLSVTNNRIVLIYWPLGRMHIPMLTPD